MPLEDSFMPEDDTLNAPTVELDGGVGEIGLNAGDNIGHYRLVSLLGEGGMGMVWLAEQEKPVKRRVAIKVIKPGMDSRAVLARFEAERQALAVMDHPCIAKVLDAGTTPRGLPYFAMELVKGEPISRFCDREQLDVRQRVSLVIQVCEAIQHAHAKGIIHRDIKPGNVLVSWHDGKPRPMVIDFGVAKALDQRLTEKTLFTEQGRVVGTPEYMSPEQADLTGLDIDTRSDIYSLGVMLYQLLTGVLPFDRKRIREAAFAEVQRMIREEQPPKPSTRFTTILQDDDSSIAEARSTAPQALIRSLRGGLDWIVMRCLEKSRARRYETANGLAMDLKRYLDDEPVMAGPPTFRYRAGRFVRRYRGRVIVAAIFVLLLMASTIVSVVLAARIETQRRRAEESLTIAQDLAAATVTKVNTALHDVPGTTEARKLLLTEGVEILKNIAANSNLERITPELARDIAVGYRGIGDAILDMGDTSLAWAQYQHAQDYIKRALKQDPDHEPSLREQAVLLAALASLDRSSDLMQDSNDKLARSIEIIKDLIATDPENMVYRRDLVDSLGQLIRPLVAAGDQPAKAIELITEAMPHCEMVIDHEPGDLDELDRLSTLLQYRGLALIASGEVDRCLDDLARSVDLSQQVHVAVPSNQDVASNLIAARQQYRDVLMFIYGNGGEQRLDEWLMLTRSNLELADDLREADQMNPSFARTAAMSRINLASLQADFILVDESIPIEQRKNVGEMALGLCGRAQELLNEHREAIIKLNQIPPLEAIEQAIDATRSRAQALLDELSSSPAQD